MGDYDPNDYTVDQVNEYLATADETETQRVLAAEAEGQARKGILEGPHAEAPDAGQGDADGTADTTTKGQTFSEAAEAATPDPRGYLGTSPERERTGAADKGLSQQSPGILDGSSPAPDARPHVDDSAALDALKG